MEGELEGVSLRGTRNWSFVKAAGRLLVLLLVLITVCSLSFFLLFLLVPIAGSVDELGCQSIGAMSVRHLRLGICLVLHDLYELLRVSERLKGLSDQGLVSNLKPWAMQQSCTAAEPFFIHQDFSVTAANCPTCDL